MIERLTDIERWSLTTEIDGEESLVGSKALRIIDEQDRILKLIRRIPTLAMQNDNYDCETAIIEALALNTDWFPANE
jgi:hypothetical protein